MHKSLLSFHLKTGVYKNIGDYIQLIAARQFALTSEFIDQSELAQYNGPVTKMIMNGWFMHCPQSFPPSNNIVPLWLSVHFTPSKIDEILRPECIRYLREFEPIGCRDYWTVRALERRGVKAYYSSCLTLTLGLSYNHTGAKDRIAFVDPLLPMTGERIIDIVRHKGFLRYVLKNFMGSFRVGRKLQAHLLPHTSGLKGWITRLVFGCAFLKTYEEMFTRETILDADFCTNYVEWSSLDGLSNVDEQFIKIADAQLHRFEEYKYVVTSRIHCALPCLAMGTPVVFVDDKLKRKCGARLDLSDGRLDGVLPFFNVMCYGDNWKLVSEFDHGNERLSPKSIVPIANNWRPFAESLKAKCRSFIDDESVSDV